MGPFHEWEALAAAVGLPPELPGMHCLGAADAQRLAAEALTAAVGLPAEVQGVHCLGAAEARRLSA